MDITRDTAISGFTFQAEEELPEIGGKAYQGVHEVSGARLLFLQNDDNNKSFAIGFRTPPQDDTGVFHILEHSVLCGSRRFPVKEPFVDLLKGSMQTFLNAMTFADKTLYPVASTNEQDLFNLMDVYLDAVFHPRIYDKKAIFEQEGWHYELHADTEGNPAELGADQTTLIHNGVVFNEMKGALSDASSVLYDELQKALFPDTCYAFESGGTPAAIPTLTYEAFLDEHRRHYRTQNSYIILYGNIDIQRALAFLDERYLTPVAREQEQADAERIAAGLDVLRPRTIGVQKPIDAGYTRHAMDTAPENACAACGYVIGTSADRTRSTAVEILLDALFGSNEAPLKRALLDAGVAHDVHAFVSDALLQPFAVVQLQMPSQTGGRDLADLLASSVRAMVDDGLDKKLIEAALSHEEFVMREHDLGYADGVINSMSALASWLYDDDAPIDYLRYERVFAELREALDTDFFERLCLELFCENDHVAAVEIAPQTGAVHASAAKDLQSQNEQLTSEQRLKIVSEEALLRELQEAPDTPEAIATLPRLAVSDIQDAPVEPAYGLDERTALPCLRHTVATHGIAYAYRYFDLQHMLFEDLPYIAILSLVLGKLDTEHHTAAELDVLTQSTLGNLTFFPTVYEDLDDPLKAQPKFVVSSSALSKNIDELVALPLEIMTETRFDSTDKILDVLKQRKIGLEQGFINSGHSCAAARCKSYYTISGLISEQLSNVGFYQFLCDLINCYDERATDLAARLDDVSRRLFDDGACVLSFAGSDEDFERFWQLDPLCGHRESCTPRMVVSTPVVRNEAFAVPSDVCYAAMGWDHRLLDADYSGSWTVAARALSLDYLWNEVRVKGGAYGTGFQALRSGNMRFYSYRDPHLDETLARFEASSTWLCKFDPSAEDLDGFIVSSVASLDAPIKPRELIRRQAGELFSGRTPEDRLRLRDQIIATDAEAIRALGPVVSRMAESNAICAFGSKAILESSERNFDVIQLVG